MTTGNFYYTDGLNMNCKPTVERVQLVKLWEGHEPFDCVLKAGGILIMGKLEDLRKSK